MGEGEDGGESDIERAARGEGECEEGCDGRGWRGEASLLGTSVTRARATRARATTDDD